MLYCLPADVYTIMKAKTWLKVFAFSIVLLAVVFLLASRYQLSFNVLFTRPSEQEKGFFWKYSVDVGRNQTIPVPRLRYGFQWLNVNATISVDLDLKDLNDLKDPTMLPEILYFTQSKRLQITCPQSELMGGTNHRGGWDVCVAEPYNLKPPCLVYSIGMAGPELWGFDRTVTKKYGCKDFAYDPTNRIRTQKFGNLLWFFAVGLSGKNGMVRKWPMKTLPTLLKENNHTETTIDILKIDIECSEWTSFDAIFASPRCLSNVKQLMVEFHPCNFVFGRRLKPEELLKCWRTLRKIDALGFKLWKVWHNSLCRTQSRKLKGVEYYGCHNAYYLNIKYLQ